MHYYKLFLHIRRYKNLHLLSVWKHYTYKSALLGQRLHVESPCNFGFLTSLAMPCNLLWKKFKGLGSRTCRIGPVNRQLIKVAEGKWHSTFLCAEHFYFHKQHLFSCVSPLLLCYRVLHMGRVGIFDVFGSSFTCLIAILTRGTATLQNEILALLRFHHSL